MKRTFGMGVLTLFVFLGAASLVSAAETAVSGSGIDYTKAIVVGCSILAAALVMALGTIGTGLGMGNGLSSAANAVGQIGRAHV